MRRILKMEKKDGVGKFSFHFSRHIVVKPRAPLGALRGVEDGYGKSVTQEFVQIELTSANHSFKQQPMCKHPAEKWLRHFFMGCRRRFERARMSDLFK